MRNKIYILITFLLLNAGAAYSAPASIKTAAVKFGFAMFGVLVSSLVIFFGLTIYNRLRDNIKLKDSIENDILKTPKSKDAAIDFYIKKNRLR